jgi:hypothetical protein
VGLFQQLNGTLHPALAPFATRAWVGLGTAFVVTAAAYTLSYLRSIRQIVETPDIVPATRSNNRLPRFGGSLATAIVQFSIRTLLRSRQHRMLLAFYLGLGFALCIVLLKTPASQQIAGDDATLPLIAATIGMMAFAVIGMRVVFAMPLELGSNWLFRSMPIASCVRYLRARRAAMFTLAVAPVVVVTSAVLFAIWPWRIAAGHTAVLALTGMILAELCFIGVQKIPFTCSYLPGKSNFHVTFWMSIVYLSALVMKGAEWERQALESAGLTAAVLTGLTAVWAAICWRNRRDAESDDTGPLFEEAPPDRIQTLDLS